MPCRGFLRAVVYSDATGSYLPLMVIHESVEESKESWQKFMDIFFSIFDPSVWCKLGLASDRDRGLIAVLENEARSKGFGHIYCHAHILRNVADHFKDKSKDVRSETKRLFQSLAFAPSVANYEYAKMQIRNKLPALLEYLSQIPPQRFTVANFPKQRYGITSNPIESFWASLNYLKIRETQGVVSLLISLHTYVIDKVHRLERDFQHWKSTLTRYAEREIQSAWPKTVDCEVSNIQRSQAIVRTRDGTYACDIATRSCSCTAEKHHAFFCEHLLKLVDTLNLGQFKQLIVVPAYVHKNWAAVLES